jgi:CRP/FNR family transcriptional regulator
MKREESTNSCTLNTAVENCFQTLTDDEMLLLENNLVVVNYKKGEILCKQGTLASHIMYICNGLVKIYMESEAGSLILKVLPAGNLIGLSALLDNNNIFRYSAYAYQDCKLRLIDIRVFKQLIRQNNSFANQVINLLCENQIQTQTRFFAFTQKQSFGRIADTLMCLSNNIFKMDEFELPLSRKELAELTGLTPESVIRILSKFKNDRVIEIDGKVFKIINKKKLQQISEYG